VRLVLSQSLDVSEDNRDAHWSGDVAGRILGAYARRRPCQIYVSDRLGVYVARIVQHELLNVEIDPLKVYEQIVDQIKEMGGLPPDLIEDVTPMEAAANTGVQSIIKQRVTILNEIATNILTSIIEEIEAVPIEIRRLCKLIRDVCKESHPELSNDGICVLVGEFVFVRLIIPALLRPHAHGLVDIAPSKNPSRTLALVSKMLQNTLGRSAQGQEPYMESIITEFSVANATRVTDFLLRVCEAQDLGVSNDAEGVLSIRMDALYHLHALLVDFGDKMASTGGYSRLSNILAKCEPRPSQAQLDSKDGRLVQFRYSIPLSVAKSL